MTVPVRRRPVRGAAVLLAAALLAGCTGGGGEVTPPSPATSAPAGSQDPANDTALARFYEQEPTWTDCRDGFECASVTVPVDWSDPAGDSIELSLLRLPAEREKVGSVLLNPGGPGVSAVDFLRSAPGFLGDRIRRAYDAVTWDPRGVSRSAPVKCLSGPAQDEWVAAETTPDSAAETQELLASLEEYGRTCAAENGQLLEHVDTVSTVRDMDVIRAALGEEVISYYGWSYGTFIGSWYAELFPWRVGRMVLDGAVDPTLDVAQYSEGQARGFSRMATAFVDDCLGTDGCPLRGSRESAFEQLRTLVQQADRQPLPTAQGRELTQSLMNTGIAQALYVPGYWEQLREALAEAFRGQGDGLLALADAYFRRLPDGTYAQAPDATTAIFCVDRTDDRTVADVEADAADWQRRYPPFGDVIAWQSIGCSLWPVEPVVQPKKLTAPGAPPILVVGTTGDPATPYEWAQALAGQLESGVLLTFEGDGHTAYRRGSKCVDRTVEDYLVGGTVPDADVTCS